MKKKRIIPVILYKDGYVVQSKNFKDYQNLGDPFTIIERLSNWMSDEIIYLNISKNKNFSLKREDLKEKNKFEDYFELMNFISKKLICPITYGGSINSLNDIEKYLRNGADKISINTAAIDNEKLINEASKEFGSQCIVVSIDYKKINGDYRVVYRGDKVLEINLFDWMSNCINEGCGEIFINSIDLDGSKKGFDNAVIKTILEKFKIPLIACGGAGDTSHFYETFTETNIEALAAANFFNHIEHGDYIVKKELSLKNLNVRRPGFFDTNNLN
jgi:imidazole glycerol-phosphate synthase subunit HisF